MMKLILIINGEGYPSQVDCPKPRLTIGDRFMELTTDERYCKRKRRLFVRINNTKHYIRDLFFSSRGTVSGSSNKTEQDAARRACVQSLESQISSAVGIYTPFSEFDNIPSPTSKEFFEMDWGVAISRNNGFKIKYCDGNTSSFSTRLTVFVWALTDTPDE